MAASIVLGLLLLLIPAQVFAQAVNWKAEVGSTGRLECVHNLQKAQSFVWEVNGTTIVYKEIGTENIKEGYGLEVEDGKMYLIIKNVKKKDAGSYKCSAFYTEGQNQDYRVIDGQLQVTGLCALVQNSLAVTLCGLLLHVLLLHL